MSQVRSGGDGIGGRLAGAAGSFVQRRSGWIVLGTLAVTALLFLPLFLMAPKETASENPPAEVFDLQREVDEKLPAAVFQTSYMVEARDGDLLTQAAMWELYQNEQRLRESAVGREYLYQGFDAESGQVVNGIYSVADAVAQALPVIYPGITLDRATDEQVKVALHYVAQDPRTSGLMRWLSVKATRETTTFAGQSIDIYRSPALALLVTMDNEKLGGGAATISLGAGESVTRKERFAREAQTLLRGEQQSYRLWGIAIDINLESQEEGTSSFRLIMLAVLVILLVVGLHFRSLSVAGLTLLGLGMLVVWLKGLSNLAQLRSSLVLDIIVPVAILSLGVDYAIHSLHRYHEERRNGAGPRVALGRGVGGVGVALVLAMVTTAAAFLSNATSGVESIIGFGIGAALAIFSALIIMGLFVPAAKMHLDIRRARRRGEMVDGDRTPASLAVRAEPGRRAQLLGRTIGFLADKRLVVLPLVLLLSGFAAFYATKLEAKLDAKEYFDSRSDFVVSLDKLDEHIAQKAGEPAVMLVEGDLSSPQVLQAMRQVVANMDDDRTVARSTSDNKPDAYVAVFDFLEAVVESDVARARIEAANPGLHITDADNDGLPDTREQLEAIYDYIAENGIPLNDSVLRYEPSGIAQGLFRDPSGVEPYATVMMVGIPGTREQAVVKESREELEADMQALEGIDEISYSGLTGSAYTRDASLDATTRSLTQSLIVAAVLCLLILVVALRSLRYGVATVIPMLLVIAWLYAAMYLVGLHLNAVTATIAAISVGVGIDYSIHLTARFRQEMGRAQNKAMALRRAASESGAALFGSAASTALGFAVIGLAPMPMFSSFGLLTAMMIVMAFIAALLVLPSLLLLVTPEKAPARDTVARSPSRPSG